MSMIRNPRVYTLTQLSENPIGTIFHCKCHHTWVQHISFAFKCNHMFPAVRSVRYRSLHDTHEHGRLASITAIDDLDRDVAERFQTASTQHQVYLLELCAGRNSRLKTGRYVPLAN